LIFFIQKATKVATASGKNARIRLKIQY